MRLLKAAAVTTAAITAVAMLTTPGAQARVAPGASAGAPGIGDRYFPYSGNGGYQVAHYGIHNTYRLRTGELTGHTNIRARATKNLSRFNLDFVLPVQRVRVNGRRATFGMARRHELVITPRAALHRGQRFRVRVDYSGFPARITPGGFNPWVANRHEVVAIGEPIISSWWYPSNDHPRDKATFDITLRIPRGREVISNGALVARTRQGEMTAWHWRMPDPMATYLAFFVAGEYVIDRGRHRGRPYLNAVSARLPRQVQKEQLRRLARTQPITRWLAGQIGRYPFGPTGGVVTSINPGFALENQSRPTYPGLAPGVWGRRLVVHEMAHQWWGNSLAVNRWRHIWLNEGFATYMEWRYVESHKGKAAQRRLLDRWREHPADSEFWRIEIAAPGSKRIFAGPVYERGAMTLQALRHRIGGQDTHQLLRTWARRHHDGNVGTHQFERLAKEVSGERLGSFFEAWLHSTRRPARTAANGLR